MYFFSVKLATDVYWWFIPNMSYIWTLIDKTPGPHLGLLWPLGNHGEGDPAIQSSSSSFHPGVSRPDLLRDSAAGHWFLARGDS